jgi:site-specific DNA recombinase
MKVIGCVRVSTEDQAKEGVSLEAQQAKIEAYCIAKD